MIWEPAAGLLTPDQARDVTEGKSSGSPSAKVAEQLVKCEILALLYMKRTLEEVPIDRVPNTKLRDFYAWLQEQCDLARAKPYSLQITGRDWIDINWTEVERFQEDLIQSGANINTLRQVGEHLGHVLLGYDDAEQVLRKTEILNRWHHEVTGQEECFAKLAEVGTLN